MDFYRCISCSALIRVWKRKGKDATVCTEAELEESAQFLASGYQKQYPDVTVKVEALPTEAEEREAAVKKIQTQTMAGEGPDIFLLPTRYGNMDIEEKEPLFENINKVVDAKVFLDLSPYMEKDEDFRAEDYQEVIFQAGRHEEKQYILPLSYRLPVMYVEKNIASANGLSSLALIFPTRFPRHCLQKSRAGFWKRKQEIFLKWEKRTTRLWGF